MSLDDCGFGYGPNPAVTGITCELIAGQALALIGPNGAGKTTIMRGVMQLIHHTGTMRIRDEVVGKQRAWKPGEIGYVAQTGDHDLTFPIRAQDVVAQGLICQPRPAPWKFAARRADRQRRRQLVEEALHAVGLAELGEQRFGTLSGGQRQRVLIARAMVSSPSLVVFDEPFNGLDVTSRDILLGLIAQLKSKGTAVLVSTHDIALAQAVADTTLLVAGRQIAVGTLADVLQPEHLHAAFGGIPVEFAAASEDTNAGAPGSAPSLLAAFAGAGNSATASVSSESTGAAGE